MALAGPPIDSQPSLTPVVGLFAAGPLFVVEFSTATPFDSIATPLDSILKGSASLVLMTVSPFLPRIMTMRTPSAITPRSAAARAIGQFFGGGLRRPSTAHAASIEESPSVGSIRLSHLSSRAVRSAGVGATAAGAPVLLVGRVGEETDPGTRRPRCARPSRERSGLGALNAALPFLKNGVRA